LNFHFTLLQQILTIHLHVSSFRVITVEDFGLGHFKSRGCWVEKFHLNLFYALVGTILIMSIGGINTLYEYILIIEFICIVSFAAALVSWYNLVYYKNIPTSHIETRNRVYFYCKLKIIHLTLK